MHRAVAILCLCLLAAALRAEEEKGEFERWSPAEWKETVSPMMAGDRTSAAYRPVAPAGEEEWES